MRRAVVMLAALSVLVAVACSNQGADGRTSRPTAGEVSLPGGVGGRLFGGPSERGVILIVDRPETDAWTALAEELGRSGYGVLVIRFAEQGGLETTLAAAEELQRRGAQRVVFVGSGRGAAQALAAAARDAAGVAVLNPPPDSVPSGAMPPVPSLLVASLTDGPSSAAAQQLYRAAREPRILALYPAKDAAPAAFEASSELKTTFLDFLRNAFQPLSAGRQST